MRYIVLLLMALTLFGSQINWQEDYESALKAAHKTHKPIYVFISAGECPWCAKFEKYTLSDPSIIKTLNTHYIPLHLVRDFDTIPAKFKQRPVPRHYFLRSNGAIGWEDIGYVERDLFLSELQTVLKEINK